MALNKQQQLERLAKLHSDGVRLIIDLKNPEAAAISHGQEVAVISPSRAKQLIENDLATLDE